MARRAHGVPAMLGPGHGAQYIPERHAETGGKLGDRAGPPAALSSRMTALAVEALPVTIAVAWSGPPAYGRPARQGTGSSRARNPAGVVTWKRYPIAASSLPNLADDSSSRNARPPSDAEQL
jgi:hypothetical protein